MPSPCCDVVRKLLLVRRRRRDGPCESKVTQLELVSCGVDQEVFRLDVSVHNPVVVAPVDRAAQLVDVSVMHCKTRAFPRVHVKTGVILRRPLFYVRRNPAWGLKCWETPVSDQIYLHRLIDRQRGRRRRPSAVQQRKKPTRKESQPIKSFYI